MATRRKKRLPAGVTRGDRGRTPFTTATTRLRPRAKPRPAPRPAARPSAPAFAPPKTPVASAINTTPVAMSGSVGGYDMGSDPAVAAAAGISAKIRAVAAAQALAKRKQAALEYGSAEGLEKDLGKDFAATQKTAAENPYSIKKSMERAYGTGVEGLEEDLNSANLFYSGYRAKQLGEAAHAYGQNQYTAANNYRSLLTDISDRLADARLQADMYDAQAALASSGGGYGGGGYSDPGYDDSVQYASNVGALSGRFGPIGTGTVRPTAQPARPTPPRPRIPSLASGFNRGRPVRGGY